MIPWQWRARLTKGLYIRVSFFTGKKGSVHRVRFDGNGRGYFIQHGDSLTYLDQLHANYWMPLNFSTTPVFVHDGRYVRTPQERVLQ